MEPLETVLEGLHRLFGFDVCPGDWAWTLMAAGVLFGFLPTAGAVTIALIRKVTGNRTSLATVIPFAFIAVLSTLALPLLAMGGTSSLLTSMRAFGSSTVVGYSSLNSGVCFGAVSQGQLLTTNRVETVLTNGTWHGWVGWPVLVGIPMLILVSVFFQGMLAFRKGARFPVWFFTGSFAALFYLTLTKKAGVMGFLWAGFLLAAIVGPIIVWLIGGPGQRAIDRASDAARARREPARDDRAPQLHDAKPALAAHAEHGVDQVDRRAVQPARPHPQQAPAPTRVEQPQHNQQQRNQQHPPTRVDLQAAQNQQQPYQSAPRPPVPQPQSPPSGQERPGLANTPGPLPFALGGPPPAQTPSSMGMAAGAAAMAAAAGVAGSGKAEMPQAGGRFRRIRQLGEGGFGKVWLAMDTNLGRTVAIKLAHAPDAEAEERMLREARALASIRHPNCVRVYDLVNEGEGLAIVMEYIEGRSLSDVVSEDGLLDDVMAARLWVTMSGALNAAHSKGVLHRDMKPSNVIVDDAAIAHLIDFGIARKRGDSTLTAAGFMLGTPDFIAPEVAAGKSASPASDAWQLAATINYALSGQPPRGDQGDPASALLAAARGGGELHLPEKSAHRAMLAAALQPDPSRRPTLGTIEREVGTWLNRGGFKQDGPVTTMIHKSQLEKTRVTPPHPPKPTPAQAAPTQITPGRNPLGDETKRVDEHRRPPHPGRRNGPTPTRKF